MCVQQEIVEELVLLARQLLVSTHGDRPNDGCNVEAPVFGLSLEILQVVFLLDDLLEQMLHALEQC
jgi:hypothetical protein